MDNETTRRYPRTLNEAFNCECDPIEGPYGREPLWPLFLIFFLVIIACIVIVWRHI